MKNETVAEVHWSFWAVGAFALVWNGLGSLNYLMQVTADTLAAYPESHRAIIEGRPVWATGGFATGVFVGALGSILLLLRKSAATWLFVVSLIGVMVTTIHTMRVAMSTIDFNAMEIVVTILLPPVVAALLVWYAKWTESKGWIS